MERPTLPVMLWRGLRRRCAWCGGRGAFFRGWFAKEDRCRTCGIEWQRGYEGFELGALAISAIVSFGSLMIALAVAIVVSWPEVPVLPLLIILGIGALVVPLIVYPISYTLWQGIDLFMHPPAEGNAPKPVHWNSRQTTPDP